MKKPLIALTILFSLSSMSFGKCQIAVKDVPQMPDANTATFEEMAEARLQVLTYMESSKNFIHCSKGTKHVKVNRLRKNTKLLMNKYNKASKIFAARAEKDPSLLKQPEPMIAAN